MELRQFAELHNQCSFAFCAENVLTVVAMIKEQKNINKFKSVNESIRRSKKNRNRAGEQMYI